MKIKFGHYNHLNKDANNDLQIEKNGYLQVQDVKIQRKQIPIIMILNGDRHKLVAVYAVYSPNQPDNIKKCCY